MEKNRRLKVCHLTSAHPDGDIRIFHKECVSLSKAGFEVYCVVTDTKERTESGVHIRTVIREKKGRFNRIISTVNAVYRKAIEIDADIYHLHDPELLRIALKLERRGKKVIYDAHEDVPKQLMDKHWIPSLIRSTISRLFSKYESYVSRRISGVISVTERICSRFKTYNPNVELVANYPLINEANQLAALDLEKVPNQLCYVGGIFPTRGALELVKAVERLDVKLELAGTFSPESFEQILKDEKGWKNVNYLGQVGRETILRVLKTSMLGVVTLHPTQSYIESLPIKMFEYMSAGLPVIASNFPEWEKIIYDSECGVCVDPLSSDQTANAIKEMLDNPEKAMKMGENGKKAFYEKYNWSIEERKLIGFYQKLAV